MDAKHIVSLELSKKLKEAGYPQEGEFWWIDNKTKWLDAKGNDWLLVKSPMRNFESYSAPLASELMERLPIQISAPHKLGDFYYLTISRGGDMNWWVAYETNTTCTHYFNGYGTNKNLCNALVSMYLHLVKEKLL